MDIDGGGGAGRGVVLAYSDSSWVQRMTSARALSRGRAMAGNGDNNDNYNNNNRTLYTSACSAPVQSRTRRKPPAKKIGGGFASPVRMVKKKTPKSKSPLVDLTLDVMYVGNDQEGG